MVVEASLLIPPSVPSSLVEFSVNAFEASGTARRICDRPLIAVAPICHALGNVSTSDVSTGITWRPDVRVEVQRIAVDRN
jgi:hypothetical protein